jgi:hypothetical protein
MGMPDTARRYTVDEVLAFPSDGNRYELVHGELLVSPAPRFRHQVVVGDLYLLLATYVKPHRHRAQVLLSPADITWGTQDDLPGPAGHLCGAGARNHGRLDQHPHLVVGH